MTLCPTENTHRSRPRRRGPANVIWGNRRKEQDETRQKKGLKSLGAPLTLKTRKEGADEKGFKEKGGIPNRQDGPSLRLLGVGGVGKNLNKTGERKDSKKKPDDTAPSLGGKQGPDVAAAEEKNLSRSEKGGGRTREGGSKKRRKAEVS